MRRVTVVLLGCILALTACGRTPATVDTNQVGTTQIPLGERSPAPELIGPSLSTGDVIGLADSPGRVTVVSSWASWCAPCVTEMPILIKAQAENPDARFLGLNTLDDRTNAEQFVEDLGITFDSIHDPEGQLLATIPGVPPQALPSTIVIDKQGNIATRIIGEVKEGQLDDILDGLARE
jgi:thiol-disulfide isomerase/thioredoxin